MRSPNALRHGREPLDLTAAAVLHRALTRPPGERSREAFRSLAEHAAADRLIAAELLKDDRGVLRPTPRAEATYPGVHGWLSPKRATALIYPRKLLSSRRAPWLMR